MVGKETLRDTLKVISQIEQTDGLTDGLVFECNSRGSLSSVSECWNMSQEPFGGSLTSSVNL